MSPIVLSDTRIRSARKEHMCSLCMRTIEPGEPYRRQRNVYYGEAFTYRGCAHCDALVRALMETGDDWFDDGEGYTRADIAEYQPRSVAIARLLVQWRRKWRRRDGALYPVPGSSEVDQ